MAGDVFTIQGTYNLVDNVTSKLKNVQADVKKSGTELDTTEGKFSKFSNGIGGMAGKIAGAVGVAFSVGAIVNFGKKCLQSASDVEEMQSKFTAVFGTLETEADAWAKSYSDSIGRNKNEIKGMIASQSDLMQGFGMTGDEALNLSQKMTTLAFDLGSFNNVADDEAVLKLQKAIMGLESSGALESLGVDLTETTMKTSEFTLATGKSWDELSRSEKMQVRYQEAMKQSSRAVGDAERTAGGFANSTKALQSKLLELAQGIGAYLLPVATDLVNWLKDGLNVVIEFVNGFGNALGQARTEMETTGSVTDGFASLFKNLFGFELPENVLGFVDGLITNFQKLWDTVMEIWETVGVPIFNTVKDVLGILADNSEVFFNLISSAWEIAIDIINVAWESILKPVFDAVWGAVDVLKAWFEEAFPEISRVVNECITIIKDLWETGLKPAFEAIGDFIQNILAPAFEFVFNNIIMPVVDKVFNGIIKLWDNSLKPILQGIVTFVSGVFTGDWSKAWEGVKSVFGGIMSGLGEVIKAPLNAVIGLINGAIEGINSISVEIPDWVPIFGGKSYGVNLPTISYLEKGGILTQPTMIAPNVMAGEKNKGKEGQPEAVIPLDRLFTELNTMFKEHLGNNNQPSNNFNVTINNAKATASEIAKQFKQEQRKLVLGF